MTEQQDDFDRRLAERLAAHESRVPDADRPELGTGITRRWWPIAVVGAGVVGGTLVVAVLLTRPQPPVGEASSSPTPSAALSREPTTSPTPVPGETATPVPTPVGTDLQWTETGSFGGGEAVELASAVVRGASGFVAVGTHYDQGLPNVGPLPPHEGRVWVSADGRSWADVTPPHTFADAVLEHIFTTADGSFIAIGRVTVPAGSDPPEGDLEPLAAWESADGLSWHRVDSGLPVDLTVHDVEHGARGYLAALWNHTGGAPQLWLSGDGRRWEQVYVGAIDEASLEIGAGDEGFAAVGSRTQGDTAATFVIASSDGREWIEASSPPTAAHYPAPFGPDWVAVEQGPFIDLSEDTQTPVWFSANGLDWSDVGSLPLSAVQPSPGDQTTCREFVVGLASAAGWLVVSTAFSYPCSEGGVQGYGTQWLSIDGTAWEPLPFAGFSFEPSPPAREDGSIILAATGADGGLVLAGQSNGRATFWIGESP